MSLSNGSYSVPQTLSVLLSDDGTPSGNVDFTGNYSVTPVDAFWQAPAGFIADLNSLQFSIGASAAIAQNEYGNLTQLTNGIEIYVRLNGVENLASTTPIRNNLELIDFGFSTGQLINYQGTSDSISSTLNISEFTNGKVLLNGDTDDRIIVRLSDNFTGLNFHRFLLGGNL